jgi:hypothetical protein
MTKLNAREVVAYCAAVSDWVPKDHFAPLPEWLIAPIATAAAIVGAASGGDESGPGGLFGTGGESNNPGDQLGRAAAAYKSGGFAAFPAYRSGAYIVWKPWAAAGITQYIAGFSQPPGVTVGNPLATTVYGAENTVVNSAVGVGNLLGWIAQPGNWVRIAKVLAGLGLVVVGAAVFVKSPGGKNVA